MKIVLREDVEKLGRKGDLLDVADGYARNYLVPRGLAIKATKGVVAQAEAMRRNREAREVRDRAAAEELATRLAAGGPLSIGARAGEAGKLFGSVTSADIAAALAEHTGVEIDRRNVLLDDSIRELGEVEVTLRLHADVAVPVVVAVVAE
jgi:large subunit ribosomal protein L9